MSFVSTVVAEKNDSAKSLRLVPEHYGRGNTSAVASASGLKKHAGWLNMVARSACWLPNASVVASKVSSSRYVLDRGPAQARPPQSARPSW
jgi:hypothetical protein